MTRSITLLIAILVCSSSLAEPVLFTCKRPAWGGKKGCDEANTYETYAFYLEEEAILANRSVDKEAFGYLRPRHVYLKVKGCDLEEGRPSLGRFEVVDRTLTLWLGDVRIGDGIFAKKIELDLDTLSAEKRKVESSPELTCIEQYGDEIPEFKNLHPGFYFSPAQLMPARPDVGGRYPVR